ncbi:MAG: hypothetical protein H6741_26645 [Alphaproteobacteria bacterium]|nr:hypothetical protein [Alphaproteobacteria bacterium]
MLTHLRPLLLTHEIATGSVDLRPAPGGGGEDALENENGQAPTLDTVGIGFARAGSGGYDVEELLCFYAFSGGSSPTVASDRRPPDVFRVLMRGSTTEFGGADDDEAEANFKDAVSDFRDTYGQAIARMESKGMRHSDLQPKTGYTNLSTAPDTFDIYDSSDDKIGEAFMARYSASETRQHWVLFSNTAFDDLKVVRRSSGGYSSLHDFLDEMQDQRDTLGVAFFHAVEECAHYLDVPVPWS